MISFGFWLGGPAPSWMTWLLVDEQAIDRSPMDRVWQPKTPRKLIPVLRDEDTGKVLDACKGKGGRIHVALAFTTCGTPRPGCCSPRACRPGYS
ncbi:hypothetical protein ABT214_14010 [Micromonospora purpureochromogenes]|uniref:hypothetical protein n=1 Tax=Micromonospora purpureochromogenes TaxID=47872 RepID=UPI00331653FD